VRGVETAKVNKSGSIEKRLRYTAETEVETSESHVETSAEKRLILHLVEAENIVKKKL
jgi:hypothetical protein